MTWLANLLDSYICVVYIQRCTILEYTDGASHLYPTFPVCVPQTIDTPPQTTDTPPQILTLNLSSLAHQTLGSRWAGFSLTTIIFLKLRKISMHIIKHTFVVYVITFMVGCGGSSNNSTDETPECVDCTPGVNDPAFLEVNLKEADSSLFLTTDELYDFDLVSENVSVADGQRTFDQQGMKLTSNTNDLSEKDFSVLSHAILRQPITFDSATIIEQEFLLENYDSTAITGDGCDFQLSFGAFSGGSRGACVARSNYEPRDRIEKFQTVVMPNSPGYFGVWHTVYKAQLEANETATSTYSSLSFRVVNPKEPVWNTLTRSVFLFSSSGFAQGKATQNRGQWSHKGIKEMLLLPPSISEENTWDINN